MSSIILLGIKHCGKSTQGKLLASHFSCPFYDTDDEITALSGKSPRDIYTTLGQEAFLEAERNACAQLAQRLARDGGGKISSVIATGGGICNNQDALAELHAIGTFLFLNVDETTAANRIIWEIKYDSDGSMHNLPAYIANKNPQTVLEVREIFHDFYVERQKRYAALCDIEVKLGYNTTKAENTQKLIAALQKALTVPKLAEA